ncbi:unnamed protein product [Hanseniaspora opuntiae]
MTTTPDISVLSISSVKDYQIKDASSSLDNDLIIDIIDKQGIIPDVILEQEFTDFVNIFNKSNDDFASFSKYFLNKDNDEGLILLSKVINLIYLKKREIQLKSISDNSSSIIDEVIQQGDLQIFITNQIADNSLIDKQYLDLGATTVEDFHIEVFSTSLENISIIVASTNPKDSIKSDFNSKIVESINKSSLSLRKKSGPFLKFVTSAENTQEHRLIISYSKNSTTKFFQLFNQLLKFYDITFSKVHIESYSHDLLLLSFYFNREDNEHISDLMTTLNQILKETSLIYCLPLAHDAFAKKPTEDDEDKNFRLSPQESSYFNIASTFIYHFIDRLSFTNNGSDILAENKNASNSHIADILTSYQQILKQQCFSELLIESVLNKYKKLVVKLFKNFALKHYPKDQTQSGLNLTISYQRLVNGIEPFQDDLEFENYLKSNVDDQSADYLILKSLKTFNDAILKTNFFSNDKLAVSFRLDPSKIFDGNSLIFPEIPYGVFFVVGSHFRGFHIRFHDIARGGIRIVKSYNDASYEINKRAMLEENYNLAYTQQKKNKDIPESGSKGVILLKIGHTSERDSKIAFERYCDSIIDILDFGSEKYIDLLGKREILFFGPDENTATLCDFATEYAKSRGCSWWKSFLTGKSASLGGIPHDEYDGDLGSNEILLSSDNEVYVAIVDGSGTIVDAEGLNKDELKRLAKNRQTVDNFDKSKLSKSGFFVSINDKNIKVPSPVTKTEVTIADGMVFRNKFHSEFLFQFIEKIDVFVPCGGRPASINLNNIDLYIDSKTGKSKIPVIVEGANLFITQDCRLKLEAAGCTLVKDSSANKGGVTSSSLEVLASLSLNDSDFVDRFVANKDGFYDQYVKYIQQTIYENARLEFEQLWKLSQSTGTPLSILSDDLSKAINSLNDDLLESIDELFVSQADFRQHLLIEKIIPKVLFEVSTESKEAVLNNIPVNYQNAMISVYLASRYVYKYGTEVNMGKFLGFISELKN